MALTLGNSYMFGEGQQKPSMIIIKLIQGNGQQDPNTSNDATETTAETTTNLTPPNLCLGYDGILCSDT